MRSSLPLIPGFVVRRHERALRSDELPFLPREPALGARSELLGLAGAACDERGGQRAALPDVVVVDLGHRGAEAVLQLRLCRLDVLALALQRARLGEVELDRENRDEAGAAAYDSSAGAPAGTGSSSDVRSTSRVS